MLIRLIDSNIIFFPYDGWKGIPLRTTPDGLRDSNRYGEVFWRRFDHRCYKKSFKKMKNEKIEHKIHINFLHRFWYMDENNFRASICMFIIENKKSW